ncbi:MAG: hypothetical protein AAB855_00615, partial [Patescibacteria group bacterium]
HKELQDQKEAYLLAKKKKLCDHLFTKEDRDYHKEWARASWSGETNEQRDDDTAVSKGNS